MTIRARAMRAEGAPIIALTIGEPDFATPRHAIDAGYQAALAGETKYPPQDGIPALKSAIQRKFKRDQDLDFALDEIMIANGGKGVIWDALMATVNPGDQVIIPAPYWGAYPLTTKIVGADPVIVACPPEQRLPPPPRRTSTPPSPPATKWLILNFPNNPTGAAASTEDLKALAAVLLRHPHVWIMSDDMYEHLMFDGLRHATMAAVEPRLRDRTLTVSGVSKTYAMTGWRIGFAAGPRHLIKAMVTMQGHVSAGISTVGQAAAAAALDGPQECVAAMVAAYASRRDIVVDALNRAPGMACHKPEGAFYVYPNVAGCLGKTTQRRPPHRHRRGPRHGAPRGSPRRPGRRRRLRHVALTCVSATPPATPTSTKPAPASSPSARPCTDPVHNSLSRWRAWSATRTKAGVRVGPQAPNRQTDLPIHDPAHPPRPRLRRPKLHRPDKNLLGRLPQLHPRR